MGEFCTHERHGGFCEKQILIAILEPVHMKI